MDDTTTSSTSTTTTRGRRGGRPLPGLEAPPGSRSRVPGACLVAAALALAAAGALDPAVPGDSLAALLAHVSEDSARWTAWSLCLVLTGLLLLPAVAALVRLPSRREPGARLTTAGGYLAGAGAVGLVALGASELDVAALASGPAPGPEVLAVAERLEGSAGLAVVFLLVLPGVHVGVPLLLWGLRRARLLAAWVPVLATAGALGSWFLSEVDGPWEGLALVATAVALLATGPLLLRGAGAPSRRAS
ncbi:hypothetical protein [Kineococcus terrestris]|uniref:hypothetical protein n=1 Tax=Kineococcus terrestris TaxID=2044856 RepID=UPI0034DB4214